MPPPPPLARTAYRLAAFGMVPVLGLLLGPLAVGCGAAGLFRATGRDQGRAFALVAIGLGLLELATNAAGLTLIGQALTGP